MLKREREKGGGDGTSMPFTRTSCSQHSCPLNICPANTSPPFSSPFHPPSLSGPDPPPTLSPPPRKLVQSQGCVVSLGGSGYMNAHVSTTSGACDSPCVCVCVCVCVCQSVPVEGFLPLSSLLAVSWRSRAGTDIQGITERERKREREREREDDALMLHVCACMCMYARLRKRFNIYVFRYLLPEEPIEVTLIVHTCALVPLQTKCV
jgi:hypothetical protein